MRTDPDPSSPLTNPRHEAFVQALVKGANATQAYAFAGYQPHDSAAARLFGNVRVRARLAHLQQLVAAKVVDLTAVTTADVLRELAKLGFSSMKDYVGKTEGGQFHVDLTNTAKDKWAAIQEVTTEVYTEGKSEEARVVRRTRIKLHGKESALVSIGKHLGMFEKDKGSAADAAEAPKSPSAERLEEMRRRYMPKPKPHLHAIEGGKQE
jgi:phage terminase small subunit